MLPRPFLAPESLNVLRGVNRIDMVENRQIIQRIPLIVAAFALGNSSSLQAGGVFSFSEGRHAAQVTFAQDGTTLSVTLENTSTFDVLNPGDVLTGVYFDIDNLDGAQLIPLGAYLSSGSSILFGDDGWDDDDGGIGGEYGFRDDLFGILPDISMVISAVGLGDLIGPPHLFPGANLVGPPSGSPAGIDFGLVSVFDDPLTGNRPVTGKSPLVSNSVEFELAGLPGDFVLDGNVSGVRFNYGSNFSPIPEPSTLVLMAFGVAATFMRRRRPV